MNLVNKVGKLNQIKQELLKFGVVISLITVLLLDSLIEELKMLQLVSVLKMIYIKLLQVIKLEMLSIIPIMEQKQMMFLESMFVVTQFKYLSLLLETKRGSRTDRYKGNDLL